MYTLRKLVTRSKVCASIAAMVVFAGHANATTMLTLQDVPLFLSTGAEPNLMIMLDSSGSMGNIVPDLPFDASTTYTPAPAACPASIQVPSNADVILSISTSNNVSSPRMNYGNNTYAWGTNTSTTISPLQRCFVSTTTYMARLNNDAQSSAPYSGNYLNWYFNTATVIPGCTDTWATHSQKPCTKSRMDIAKAAATSLVDSISSGMRVGLSTYVQSQTVANATGGSLREQVGLLNSAKKATIKTKITALSPNGYTPLAETLQDIGAYFATGYNGNLTLHPGAANQSTASVATVFGSRTLQNDTGDTTIDNPIQYSCQKSFAVLLTDGRPNADRSISTSLRDYSGDCAASPSQCDATPTAESGTGIPTGPLPNTTYKNGTKVNSSYEQYGSDYLDDVAMGLYQMDLRPDKEDTVGSKNNLVTYLIGFADPQLVRPSPDCYGKSRWRRLLDRWQRGRAERCVLICIRGDRPKECFGKLCFG